MADTISLSASATALLLRKFAMFVRIVSKTDLDSRSRLAELIHIWKLSRSWSFNGPQIELDNEVHYYKLDREWKINLTTYKHNMSDIVMKNVSYCQIKTMFSLEKHSKLSLGTNNSSLIT